MSHPSEGGFPRPGSGPDPVNEDKRHPETIERTRNFIEAFFRAQNLADLRTAWDQANSNNTFSNLEIKPNDFSAFQDIMRNKLTELGLDFTADDERVVEFIQALRDVPVKDYTGCYTIEREDPFQIALFRILSGCDINAAGLQLLPLEPLQRFERGDYTASDAARLQEVGYDFTRSFPIAGARADLGFKGLRTITDISSEFWGCRFYYDGFPGRRRENIAVEIPTGRVNLHSIKHHNDWRKEIGHQYSNDESFLSLSVRYLHSGYPETGFNTSSDFVQRLLGEIERITRQEREERAEREQQAE
ncbi:MAG: hypothetical protein V1898_00225 [Patescibacteria group bacterium]